jgi:hypothetical protein
MNIRRATLLLIAAVVSAVPLSTTTGAQGADKAPADVIVHFGDPFNLAGAVNQVVLPNDLTIRKDGTVTFVVYGPGHGIGIYPVSNET